MLVAFQSDHYPMLADMKIKFHEKLPEKEQGNIKYELPNASEQRLFNETLIELRKARMRSPDNTYYG